MFSEIAHIKKGQQLNKLDMVDNGKFYVLNGGMAPSGRTNNYNTPQNTISISEGGNSCGYVKYNTEPFWSGGHCYTIHNISNFVFEQFLYQYLKYKESDIMSLRVGSGLPNIQKGAIENFLIYVPKLEEQKKISCCLKGLIK